MNEHVTIRRWTLKGAATEAELVALVRHEIMPHYAQVDGCLGLELLRIDDSRSYVAVTRWRDRGAFEAWEGSAGDEWRAAYVTMQERWGDLMTFEDEWQTERLL